MTDGLTPGADGTGAPDREVPGADETGAPDRELGDDTEAGAAPADDDLDDVQHDSPEVHGGPTLSELDEES